MLLKHLICEKNDLYQHVMECTSSCTLHNAIDRARCSQAKLLLDHFVKCSNPCCLICVEPRMCYIRYEHIDKYVRAFKAREPLLSETYMVPVYQKWVEVKPAFSLAAQRNVHLSVPSVPLPEEPVAIQSVSVLPVDLGDGVQRCLYANDRDLEERCIREVAEAHAELMCTDDVVTCHVPTLTLDTSVVVEEYIQEDIPEYEGMQLSKRARMYVQEAVESYACEIISKITNLSESAVIDRSLVKLFLRC